VFQVYTAEPGSPSAERLRLLALLGRNPGGCRIPGRGIGRAAQRQQPELNPRLRGNPDAITRSSLDTVKGPNDWFTGDVYIDAVAANGEAHPSKSSAQATASYSKPTRNTGTAPHPTDSWSTSPSTKQTQSTTSSAGSNRSATPSTPQPLPPAHNGSWRSHKPSPGDWSTRRLLLVRTAVLTTPVKPTSRTA